MDLPALARTAAERAADWIRRVPTPAPRPAWDIKGHHDYVTEVDRTAEAMIAEILLGAEPGSRIVGEELSPELALDGLVWLVDPLDGTTNFLHRYPQYAVSVAAAVDGELVAAAVTHVPLGVTIHAARGCGCFAGEERLRVSATAEPPMALIGTGFPFKHLHHLERYQRQFATVMRGTSGVRRAGSAALDLADVAAGRFDAFWELMLAPWDTAAGILLVREAGGVVTNLEGEPAGIAHSGIVAGNPVIHRWLLEIVKGEQ
jgi:myo-inositol-1(or 4)-monophosphatase